PLPGRGRPPPPERTEVLSPTPPKHDDDRTLVMTRRSEVRAQTPMASSSQLDPMMTIAAAPSSPRPPDLAPPTDPSLDSTLQLPSPLAPVPEVTLRRVLLVVNIALGIALVV